MKVESVFEEVDRLAKVPARIVVVKQLGLAVESYRPWYASERSKGRLKGHKERRSW